MKFIFERNHEIEVTINEDDSPISVTTTIRQEDMEAVNAFFQSEGEAEVAFNSEYDRFSRDADGIVTAHFSFCETDAYSEEMSAADVAYIQDAVDESWYWFRTQGERIDFGMGE